LQQARSTGQQGPRGAICGKGTPKVRGRTVVDRVNRLHEVLVDREVHGLRYEHSTPACEQYARSMATWRAAEACVRRCGLSAGRQHRGGRSRAQRPHRPHLHVRMVDGQLHGSCHDLPPVVLVHQACEAAATQLAAPAERWEASFAWNLNAASTGTSGRRESGQAKPSWQAQQLACSALAALGCPIPAPIYSADPWGPHPAPHPRWRAWWRSRGQTLPGSHAGGGRTAHSLRYSDESAASSTRLNAQAQRQQRGGCRQRREPACGGFCCRQAGCCCSAGRPPHACLQRRRDVLLDPGHTPGSYTPPTSITTSRVLMTSGSRVRTMSAPANLAVWRSRKAPSASSQWKEPLCVPAPCQQDGSGPRSGADSAQI
jgi:hypothetical protein